MWSRKHDKIDTRGLLRVDDSLVYGASATCELTIVPPSGRCADESCGRLLFRWGSRWQRKTISPHVGPTTPRP